MNTIGRLYLKFAALASSLKSPLLLAVRLYWGWQLVQTGWGKLQHLDRVTAFFSSLNIPLPGLNAHFVAGLEVVGGVALILGVASRLFGLLLTIDLLVAYWTADRMALTSIFSDPGKFYGADPYTFLFAALIVLIFGAGLFSIDAWINKAYGERIVRQ